MRTLFSGIQPSAVSPHIGNYIGALRQWKELEGDALYCVVDLHALTVPQKPDDLRQSIETTYAFLLALNLHEQAIVFVQSHVPQHAQLAWIMQTISHMGQLSRMTQYKDKAQKFGDGVPTGLFTYPTLMASDILLYDTQLVPVGEDQVQHVELARDLAMRFNRIYGETFVIPAAHVIKGGARIMNLQNPLRKMSKSDENPSGVLFMTDSKDTIRKKIGSAVTDSQSEIVFDQTRPGLYNLLTIYQAVTGMTRPDIEKSFAGKGYRELKDSVSEAVADALTPIQEKYNGYIRDPNELRKVMEKNALEAQGRAEKKLRDVYARVGIRM